MLSPPSLLTYLPTLPRHLDVAARVSGNDLEAFCFFYSFMAPDFLVLFPLSCRTAPWSRLGSVLCRRWRKRRLARSHRREGYTIAFAICVGLGDESKEVV